MIPRIRSKLVRLIIFLAFVYAIFALYSINNNDVRSTRSNSNDNKKDVKKRNDEIEHQTDNNRNDNRKQLVRDNKEEGKDDHHNNNKPQIDEPLLNEKEIDRLAEKFGKSKTRVKDWHNYQQIAAESQRQGPGEQGVPYILSQEDAKSPDKHNLLRANGFNALASDKISLQRALNDIRDPAYESKFFFSFFSRILVLFNSCYISYIDAKRNTIWKIWPK